jgi:hypothetical protein
MTSQPFRHTSYIDSMGQPRGGSTGHSESQVDLTQYHQPLEQVHGSSLHTWGIAVGLTVSAVSGQPNLTVTTGIGLDSTGRHISLATSPASPLGILLYGVCLGAAATPTPVTGNTVTLTTTSTDSGDRYLTIEWKETFDDKTWNATQQQIFQQLHTPWLRLQPTTLPNTGQALILGHVTIDASGNVTDLKPDGRRVAGSMVGALQVQKLTAASAPNIVLDSATAGGIQPLASGGLEIAVSGPSDEIHLNAANVAASGNIRANGDISAGTIGATEGGVLRRLASGGLEIAVSGPSDEIHLDAANVAASGSIRANGDISAHNINAGTSGVNGELIVNNANNQETIILNGGIASVQIGNANVNGAFEVIGPGGQAAVSINGQNGQVLVGQLKSKGQVVAQSQTTYALWGVVGGGGIGLYTRHNDSGNEVYLATSTSAAEFTGPVSIGGPLKKPGGAFKIDHPLDPPNRYLSHSFVESPDMKNVYDGVVVLDANGQAQIELPPWFEALNRDFRYQLTCVGGYAPVYIAEKIHNGHFTIAGGTPDLEVCWQVTGIRKDAWANAYRIPVEEDKPPMERGYYLHPELYGADEEKRIQNAHRHDLPPQPQSVL